MSTLETNKLWKEASLLAEDSYSLLEELPEDEQYGMRIKFRSRAFDVTTHIAEALGSIDPRDKKYSYGLARQNLFGLKNAYLISHKTGRLQLEPDIIVRIDSLTDEIDKEIAEAGNAIPKYMEQFEVKKK
jgi:four helix bundle protein